MNNDIKNERNQGDYVCEYCVEHVTQEHRCTVPFEIGQQVAELALQILCDGRKISDIPITTFKKHNNKDS